MRKILCIAAFAMLMINMVSFPIFSSGNTSYSEIEGTLYEAEDGILENVEVVQEFHEGGNVAGYSGAGFVGEFNNSDSKPSALVFEIEVPETAKYDLIFMTCSPHDKKFNSIQIDNETPMHEALESPKSEEFMKRVISVELTAGSHTVRIIEGWGFMYIDALIVNKQVPKIPPLSADAAPVNPNATAETVALMNYLNESYGNVIISGQYADGINSPEIQAIYYQTGKYPAIMGFDFLYYGKTASENRTEKDNTTQLAIDWWNSGGIVTYCWHWFAPKDNVLSQDLPWNKSFYSQATTFNLEKALNGEDTEAYDMLISDIDDVSEQLAILQKAGVPVLWRPLHEASGGWFWWGSYGSDTYKKLWDLMYDRMVNVNGLNNLIWVWNGQHNDTDGIADWYPGDDTVDIISEDIYADKQEYSSQVERFSSAMKYTSTNKIIALSETGVIPDPDELIKDGNMWSWFAPWYREFVVDMSYSYPTAPYSDEYTEINMLRKVYNHEKVITLDELPALNPNAVKPTNTDLQKNDSSNDKKVFVLIIVSCVLGLWAVVISILFMLNRKK